MKKEQRRSHAKECTLIDWPNSLKTVPSGVANCRNLPFGGRATRGLTGASSMEGNCAESPPTFIAGKCRKNRKGCGLWTLSVKGLGVVFTHGEGISTPHVRHKGQQPLIKCANMTSKCFIFPFLCLFVFLCFFMFFYLFVVDKGVSLAPTYSSIVIRKSDLRNSLRTERWLSCFYLLQDIFWPSKSRLRRWTI